MVWTVQGIFMRARKKFKKKKYLKENTKNIEKYVY
jgi:hypothetical protein